MVPEQQARNPEPLTPMADVFALGCVLLEMPTGKVHQALQQASSVPAWLARALEQDPSSRYESAEEMAAALRTGLAEEERQQISPDGWMVTEAGQRCRAEAQTWRETTQQARVKGTTAAVTPSP